MMIQLSTTSDDRNELLRIADHLISNRLAACCQIEGPFTSIYLWEGQVESCEEFRCVIKSTQERYAAIESAILSLHHYACPQIVGCELPMSEANYVRWASCE